MECYSAYCVFSSASVFSIEPTNPPSTGEVAEPQRPLRRRRAVPFRGDGYSLSLTSPSALTSVSASSSESKPKRQEQPGRRGVCHQVPPQELPGSGGDGCIEAGCDCWAVNAAGVAGTIDSMPLRGIQKVSQGPLGSRWQTETANRQRFLLRAELRSAQVTFWADRRTHFLCRDALRAALAERRE